MQCTTTAETSMQVILQKGRHAPWKIFPDKLLVSFSAIVASSLASPVLPGGDAPSGASAVAPPPMHRWNFCHRWCTRKNYHVNNKYKMELINYSTPRRERRAADNGDTNVAAIRVVRNERGRSLSREDQGGRCQVPDGSARDSVRVVALMPPPLILSTLPPPLNAQPRPIEAPLPLVHWCLSSHLPLVRRLVVASPVVA
jgi:hypothetical protein